MMFILLGISLLSIFVGMIMMFSKKIDSELSTGICTMGLLSFVSILVAYY